MHRMTTFPRYALTSKKLFDDSEMIDVEIQNKKISNDAQIFSS